MSLKQRESSFVAINRLLVLPCSEEVKGVKGQGEAGLKSKYIIKDTIYETLQLKIIT